MAIRSFRHRPSLTLALICGLGLLLAAPGCGGPEAPAEPERTSIRFPLSDDPAAFSFARAQDSNAMALIHLIGDSLVTYDKTLAIQPRLASSWEWGSNKRVLTFHLRKDAFWHDGTPVTSADVVHTAEVFRDPKRGSSNWGAGFVRVRNVEALDSHTVQVTYSEPYSPALAGWTCPIIPAHRPDDDEQMVGCGPWILDRWERGERVVLRANKEYFGGAPQVETLEFEIIGDYSTRFAALKAGRIDACNLLPQQYTAVLEDEELRSRLEFTRYQILYFWYLAWATENRESHFTDPGVRRAMTQAIDRQGFLENFGFQAEVATTSFHPGTWAYDPSLEPWPYDPDQARRLLADAGWKDSDGDGVLDRNGVPFRFTLIFSQTSTETEKIAVVVQSALKKIGVVMELQPLEWAVFLERTRNKDFEATMGGWRLDPDPDPHDIWHSTQADRGGANYSSLRDPQVDTWIEQAQTEFDLDLRREIYWKLQRRLHQLQPETFFFYPETLMAYDRRLAGFEGSPLGPIRFAPGPSAWHWLSKGETSERPDSSGGEQDR